MKRFFLLAIVASAVAVPIAKRGSAYVFSGSRWPSPATTMYVSMGSPWDSALITAMALWNHSTVFHFTYFSQYSDPCSNPTLAPARNGAKFSNTSCGEPWGDTTLAVTLSWSTNGGTRAQAGVIFNS